MVCVYTVASYGSDIGHGSLFRLPVYHCGSAIIYIFPVLKIVGIGIGVSRIFRPFGSCLLDQHKITFYRLTEYPGLSLPPGPLIESGLKDDCGITVCPVGSYYYPAIGNTDVGCFYLPDDIGMYLQICAVDIVANMMVSCEMVSSGRTYFSQETNCASIINRITAATAEVKMVFFFLISGQSYK